MTHGTEIHPKKERASVLLLTEDELQSLRKWYYLLPPSKTATDFAVKDKIDDAIKRLT